MATPRTTQQIQPPKLNCRRPDDFPAFVAANDKLTDLQTRLHFKEAEVREADKHPQEPFSRVEADARAILDGGVATLEAAPDLSLLRREVETLRRAIELQSGIVQRERQAMAREIAKDLAAQDRELIGAYISAQQAALDAYAAMLALRGSAASICGTDCLPPFALNAMKKLVHDTNFREFVTFTADYLQGGAK